MLAFRESLSQGEFHLKERLIVQEVFRHLPTPPLVDENVPVEVVQAPTVVVDVVIVVAGAAPGIPGSSVIVVILNCRIFISVLSKFSDDHCRWANCLQKGLP